MPDWNEKVFLIVIFLNTLIAVVYFLWGTMAVATVKERQMEEGEKLFDNRRAYLLKLIIMLLCPIIGPLFFALAYLTDKLLFWTTADLEDVIFSKDRVKTQLKADEERARNMVPLEEALAINEKKNLRLVMMNMVKGEISHYAASVMTDELNEFRTKVQALSREIQNEKEEETGLEELLIAYMDKVLKLQIFTAIEQKRFVKIMADAAEKLWQKDMLKMKEEQYESVCLRMMEVKEYEGSEKWCLRLAEQYPDKLSAYTCRLKTLNDLKRSDVVIDRETLELIRVFS